MDSAGILILKFGLADTLTLVGKHENAPWMKPTTSLPRSCAQTIGTCRATDNTALPYNTFDSCPLKLGWQKDTSLRENVDSDDVLVKGLARPLLDGQSEHCRTPHQ